MGDDTKLYVPEDDCTTGQCGADAAFIPQDIGNFDLDALFAGLEVDQQLDLGIATVEEEIRSDELFPPIIPGAPITLVGVIDVFARRYPDRAQLLDMLINREGYELEFVDNVTGEEAALRRAIATDEGKIMMDAMRVHPGMINYQPSYDAGLHRRLSDNKYRLESLKHWRIADKKILITTRINKNIDKFNWWFGMDDNDLIFEDVTNDDGADWLNRVMGDWMVRSGIPGASASEEFQDSWSSRVIWGSLNVIVGAAEVIGGVVVAAGTSWSGVGLLAGGAMTIAGIEALTQGIDMIRTPNQSSHQMGWLGDAAFAMSEKFGLVAESDQAAFSKYWAFTMLGLSLGGAGVSAFLPAAKATLTTARATQQFGFLARTYDRTVDAARLTMVGIKEATFGALKVSYAAMPSGRIMLNIKGVGRVVAEAWESIPRLRLRMTIGDKAKLLERSRKLRAGEAGIISLRSQIKNTSQARKLVYDVAKRMGLSGPELDNMVSAIRMGTPGQSSAFTPATRGLRIADDIGFPRNLRGWEASQYNELVAINEVAHEIAHVQRFTRWAQRTGGTADEFMAKYGRRAPDNGYRYYIEEIRVERAAMQTTMDIVQPRIALARAAGRMDEVERLESLLAVARRDSEAYIAFNRRRAGL